MRKSPGLVALFPGTRQAILTAVLMHPERWWYLSDLARHLSIKPSSLQRELKSLVQGGILRFRKDGNRAYYQADDSSPLFGELSGIVRKTSGLVEVLRAALEPLRSRIRVAFVFGSIVEGREKSSSDVDLCVIGDLSTADLAPPIRRVEEEIGRSVSLVHYTPEEFANQKLRSHFMSEIAEGPKLPLIGDERELEEVARVRASRNAQNVRSRAGRVAEGHSSKSRRRRRGGSIG